MKKLTTTALICCLTLITGLSSCSKPTAQSSTMQVTYRGAEHTYASALGMYIYQSANYSTVQAEESATQNTISLNYRGVIEGTYTLGAAYTNTLTMTVGGITYSSQSFGGHGSVIITDLDAATLIAKGTYSGTLYNTNTASDSIVLTQGTLSVKYQL